MAPIQWVTDCTVCSLPAGLTHMSHWRFLLFTFAGAAVWNAALIRGGEWLARYLKESGVVMDWLIGGTIAAALLAYIWRVITWKPRG